MCYLLSYSFQVCGAWDWVGAIYVKLHHGTVDHGDGGCYRFSIGYYKIARETASKFVPQTVPVSCETSKFEVARETGQCYVKLHHGTVLGMLSLLLLAGLKFALQTVLQCSLAPHCQSLRPDCIIELSWAISSFIVYMMQSCPRKWVKIRPGGGGTRSLMGDARMANERLREQQK